MLTVAVIAFLTGGTGAATVHHGRNRELDVRPPRIEAQVAIDGRLDEAPWSEAVVLTGFSRYSPTDGMAADDSTDVLVWYSPTAIHFGIRAFAPPGSVNATLADRDKIYNDDHLSIFLGTFNNGREAMVFSVNPLGVQGDGTVLERGVNASTGFGVSQIGREPTDIAPDYVFQSKGRLTDFGYEVEIRIPFKSLRYQSAPTQTWGVNVMRRVQSRGYEYTWTPAERGAASFIGQSGFLRDLRDLHRGVVLDLNPIVTARSTGARAGTPASYDYTESHEFGGNVRWGISNNWALNGTVKPDFAEVESDAGQIVNDPRRALFFAERRPFFLDGIEQFAVGSNLIYTRRIAAPLVAAKVIGKRGGTTYALMSAVDDELVSFSQKDRPIYNILRVQHDVGRQSRIGLVYTDRMDGDFANRMLGTDARIVWKGIYSAQLLAAGSRTEDPTRETGTGQHYNVALRRTGRAFQARYSFNMLSDDFDAQAGFINRPSVAQVNVRHSYTHYNRPGSLLERTTAEVAVDGLWNYQRFVHGNDMIEKKLHFNNNFSLRGGWSIGASFLVETFGFDDNLFGAVYVGEPGANGTTTYRKFTGRDRLGNIDYVFSVTTPNYQQFSGSVQVVTGRDENFYEWTSANIGWVTVGLNWRPTEQLRANLTYNWQGYKRLSDNSTVAETHLPRLRVEYQLARSIFMRVVGQYTADYADDLRESDRSDLPLYRLVGSRYVAARGFSTVERRAKRVNTFRPEFLFSYLPSPGTVIYAGYGTTLTEPERFRFGRGTDALTRQSDAVFVKLSWLFRVQ